jgi:tetratricopeptide (TPR) repeat protein
MRTLATILIALVLAPAALGQTAEAPAPNLSELLERADLFLRQHRLDQAEKLYEQVRAHASDPQVAQLATLRLIEIVARRGELDRALGTLVEAMERVAPASPEIEKRAARMKRILEAAILARDARVRALEAKLEATELAGEAEKAEARARLLYEDMPEEKIEQHLAGIRNRFDKELRKIAAEIEEVRTGKPPPTGIAIASRTSPAVLGLQARGGMSHEEAVAEAERRIATLRELGKRRATLDRERRRRRPEYASNLREHMTELRKRLAEAQGDGRTSEVRRLRGQLEILNLRLEIEKAKASGEKMVVSLEHRLNQLEKRFEEMHAMLTKLLEAK